MHASRATSLPIASCIAILSACRGPLPATSETSATSDSDTDAEVDTGTVDDLPSAPTDCGDGVVDPGEACDDGNDDDGDGCTAACEIGPCGFEWITTEPTPDDDFDLLYNATAVDGETIVSAYHLGELSLETRLTWVSGSDGTITDALTVDLAPTSEYMHGLALAADGDLILGNSDFTAIAGEVRRLTPAGDELWVFSRPSTYLRELVLAPTGEIVLVTSEVISDVDFDVGLVGLDPLDGAQLWVHTIDGQDGADGVSNDQGQGLIFDGQGRKFVAWSEYVAVDASRPSISAFSSAPGWDDSLWIAALPHAQSQQYYFRDLAVLADGVLIALFGRFTGGQASAFSIAAIDADTGELLWDNGGNLYSLPGQAPIEAWSLAASGERIMVVGAWRRTYDDMTVWEAFSLGLGADGSRECLAILDLYDPDDGIARRDAHFRAVEAAPDGGFYLTGYRPWVWFGSLDAELLFAKVR